MRYEIYLSRKRGFNTNESYIVTRGRDSFLRVVGEEPNYVMMTTTADEDGGKFLACNEKVRLLSAALRLSLEIGTQPVRDHDKFGREFLRICSIHMTDPNSWDDVDAALRRFFELYDGYEQTGAAYDETREIYGHLAIDDSGADVYLGDGVWLSSDGSLHDRGR